MRVMLVVLLIALFGCGGDAAPGPELEGLWYFSSDTEECGYGLFFEGDKYETDIVCTLQNGATGIEAEAGTFTSTDSQIVVTPKASSCANTSPASTTISYDFVDDKLRLVLPRGVLIFERLERTDGEASSGSSTYGCYDSEGTFSPMPVQSI